MLLLYLMGFPGSSVVKESACQCRRCRYNPWVGKIPWRREMATHSSIVAWEIPWTEEPGRLQSMGPYCYDLNVNCILKIWFYNAYLRYIYMKILRWFKLDIIKTEVIICFSPTSLVHSPPPHLLYWSFLSL